MDIEDINQGLRHHKELIDTMQRDVYKVHIDSKLQDSVRTILKRNVRNIPVVDNDNTLIGLITRANLVDIVYDSIWGEEDQDMTLSDSHMNDVERENELGNQEKKDLAQQNNKDATDKQKDVTDRLDTHDLDETHESGVDR